MPVTISMKRRFSLDRADVRSPLGAHKLIMPKRPTLPYLLLPLPKAVRRLDRCMSHAADDGELTSARLAIGFLSARDTTNRVDI
ncbi:hypothetical protein ACVCIC_25215 [Burkholderia glumae]|uniref:hypothetical protein n=1 Tax=Burkholderia glumae TaxID=337 RepID=UPI0020367A7F|nr:hypothetical protein [Burkholderia glumae]MCM2548568.1 hypothetical protein [Burkholderia glumae]